MELRAVIIYNHELVNIEIRIHVLVSVNSACGRWKSGTGGWVGGSIGERVGEWGLVWAGVGGFGRVWVGVWVCVAKSKTNLAAMSVCQKTVCAIPCFVGA